MALNANDKMTDCLSEHNAFRGACVADKLSAQPIQNVSCASVLDRSIHTQTLHALRVQVQALRADVAEAKNVYRTLGKRMDVLDLKKSSAVMHEIVSDKHIQMSTDVEHAVYETTPQVGEPTDDQKGGLAPSTNCSVPSRRSSPDSFENMYDGLENLLEAMGYTVVYKRGVQKMSSLDKAMVAEFQKQTALQINQLDIDNTLRYIRTFKDDARLSPHTMASVLAKIANTLARHYDKWEYAIKFCVEAHECFKNTLDESVELKVDQARNLCIGSMCNNNLGWHSAAYGWAQKTQEILCKCMAITSEDTEVLKKVAWIQNQCGISYYTYGTEHSKELGIAYLNTAHSVYKSLQDVESMEKVRANILSTCSETEN